MLSRPHIHALAVALLLPATALAQVRIGIVGDQTGTDDLDRAYEVLEAGAALLAAQDIEAVLHTGDLIESTFPDERVRSDFERAAAILDTIGAPWHLTPGDHDVNPPERVPDSTDRSKETLYRELYRNREPGLTDALDHSFDIGGYHFVALNSRRRLHTDPRWGNVFMAGLADEQLNWLERDLAASRESAGIVVFTHQPLWYNWAGWSRVHELLRQYPVVAVVAGHFHYDQDEGTLDGIRYVIVGATGGSVKDAHRDAGNAHHVTVMTLDGSEVRFQLLEVGDGRPLGLTPRAAMDRVQALDVALGSPGFGGVQGRLCRTAGSTARVEVSGVGNPLDIPLRIRIAPRDSASIGQSRYADGICVNTDGDSCILEAGRGVRVSNNSLVELRPEAAEVLWIGELKGGSPPPGVMLDLRASFQSGAGELFVERELSAMSSNCAP